MLKFKFNITKQDFKLYLGCLVITILTYSMIFTLSASIIHAQGTPNVWNIQRNTQNNDLDFYLTTNGVSGSSLRLNSNGNARVRSLYDLDDTSNTYLIDPNGSSRFRNLAVDNISLNSLSLYSKDALQGADSWLRLNQSSQFTSGTHTPGLFAPGSLNVAAEGWANPGYGNAVIGNNLRVYNNVEIKGYNGLNLTYAGFSTPNGTFRLTPNVHINTPTNYGVIINWDNGSTGDASVGQFVVGNGYGGVLFRTLRSGVTESNYYHTYVNGSWFPYVNGYNYFRGPTFAFNGPWYDENHTGYYIDPYGSSQFHALYRTYGFNGRESDINNGNYYVDPSNDSNFLAAYRYYGYNGREYDGNNGNYYVDPSETSQYNALFWLGGGQNSDIRLKKDIIPLQNSLERILKLQGVSYYFKPDGPLGNNFPKEKQIGLVAQDVETIVPEVITTNKEGYKAIDYGKLTSLLIEAMKNQQNQISKLEKQNEKINLQQQEIETLHREIEDLKDR